MQNHNIYIYIYYNNTKSLVTIQNSSHKKNHKLWSQAHPSARSKRMRPNKWQNHIPSYVFQQKLIGKEVPYMGLPSPNKVQISRLWRVCMGWWEVKPIFVGPSCQTQSTGPGPHQQRKAQIEIVGPIVPIWELFLSYSKSTLTAELTKAVINCLVIRRRIGYIIYVI